MGWVALGNKCVEVEFKLFVEAIAELRNRLISAINSCNLSANLAAFFSLPGLMELNLISFFKVIATDFSFYFAFDQVELNLPKVVRLKSMLSVLNLAVVDRER